MCTVRVVVIYDNRNATEDNCESQGSERMRGIHFVGNFFVGNLYV